MCALVKIKSPIEYSFYIWMGNYPESTHPKDIERFLSFVRNVCRYNGKKWKRSEYVKEKVLKEKPNFNYERLQELMIIYEYLINFYTIRAFPAHRYFDMDVNVKNGHYLERGVKKGEFYEEEKLLPKV